MKSQRGVYIYSVPDTPGSLLSVIKPLYKNWHFVSLFCVKKKNRPILGGISPSNEQVKKRKHTCKLKILVFCILSGYHGLLWRPRYPRPVQPRLRPAPARGQLPPLALQLLVLLVRTLSASPLIQPAPVVKMERETNGRESAS